MKKKKSPVKKSISEDLKARVARFKLTLNPATKMGKTALYILSGRPLRSWQAINFWGYTRLSDGIFRLRDRFAKARLGEISTELKEGLDRYNNTSTYAIYRWVKPVVKNKKPVKKKK